MLTLSPEAQVRLRAACYPVVRPSDDPTELRWIARGYRDCVDLNHDLAVDVQHLLVDVAITLELGALLIELAPVLDNISAATPARPAAVTDPRPASPHDAGRGSSSQRPNNAASPSIRGQAGTSPTGARAGA